MNLYDAEILAKTLISEFIPNYAFAWNNLKTVNGRCVYSTKTIELSRHRTPLRTNQAVMQTIMHEIAHALHPKAGHGPAWKAQMRAFGLSDERCSSDAIDKEALSNWKAVCWKCKKESFFIRKPRLTRSCGNCGNGVYNEAYKLIFVRI